MTPDLYGFGLGWLVFQWGETKLVWHGGNDQHEHAVGYINPKTGHGAVVFVNGAQGIPLMLDTLDVIDDTPLTAYYRALMKRVGREY